ncbi:MAG TPA: AgmX/PglI C-terminal domain-containing protein, partial [Kofleriaceae bacterium]|nr:AgmX/PglI C-terminal domain-containing protein [Kofleriaceae bacterium]
APAAVVPAAPLDPIEAALLKAEANAAAPRPAATPAGARPAPAVDLHATAARTAAGVGLSRGPVVKNELPDQDIAMQMQARTVDQKAISAVIRADMRALQYCIDSLRIRGVSCGGGSISLNFTIEPKGTVSTVKISAGGANAAKLETCLSARVKAWKFPAADAPTTVSYPLVLENSVNH